MARPSVPLQHSLSLFVAFCIAGNLEEALSHHVDSPLTPESAAAANGASAVSAAEEGVDPLSEEAGAGSGWKKRSDFGIEGSLLAGSGARFVSFILAVSMTC